MLKVDLAKYKAYTIAPVGIDFTKVRELSDKNKTKDRLFSQEIEMQ